ncbi:hypothetical protein DFJ74DRAFT_668168 [Hyaloraphidium curvatum]|nr:hypothetical protein DFJ74DRAFT_668168 [Hyaloraphidium curvatum]
MAPCSGRAAARAPPHRAHTVLRGPAMALLLLLALAIHPAAGALSTCADMAHPGPDADGSLVTLIGPLLLTPPAPGYPFLINDVLDSIEIYVQSFPGVGPVTNDAFTRKLVIQLSDPNTTTYDAAVSNNRPAGCRREWDRFQFSSIPSGVSVYSGQDLTDPAADGAASTCYFVHKYQFGWEDFRNATMDNCGFLQTQNDTGNGQTYIRYDGRVFVWWEDYANFTTSTPYMANTSLFFDVTFQTPGQSNMSSPMTNNTEIPYNYDFKVSSLTYSKSEAGLVEASIAYQLSTNWPYYAYFAEEQLATPQYNILKEDGQGLYAGLDLDAYPSHAWTNTYVNGEDGQHQSGGSAPCSETGDQCYMSGILKFTWKPTDGSTPDSCSIASATPYQFDIILGCLYNNGSVSICNVSLAESLSLADVGKFTLAGDIDFCKSASSNLPITWSPPFDVVQTSRTIGQTIEANGAFTNPKQLSAVAVKEYRVSRGDLTGYWSLLTPAAATATASGSAGVRTTVGENVNFVRSITPSDSDRQWSIRTSFTPNIKLYSSVQSSFGTVGSRGDYMISMPNDRNLALAYTITILLRMYADDTQNFNGQRRRRLMYRDANVPEIRAVSVDEKEVQTSPVTIQVPENMQVSKDGTVTTFRTSSSLSTGAIAGIAAMGAVVGAAIAGLITLLVLRRKRRNAEAEAAAAAVEQVMGKAKRASKSVPTYSKTVGNV